MDFETFSVKTGSHVPGTAPHRYLTAYAQHFGMYEKVRFGCCVKKTELRDDGSWEVSYEKENKGEVKVKTKKPVLATGTTSLPHMPEIKGRDYFKGHVFHSKELPFRGEDMENSENVVVMGGSKSAIDSVYINAIKGRHVDWVIRESGKGLAWLSPAFVSPLKLQFEKLATVRAMTFLSPCFDSTYSPIRYLLHNTRIGRAFVRGFFSIIHGDLLENGKFNAHPDTKKLISPGNIFWSGTSVGIFNYPTDLFSLVQKRLINIHIADITSLSPTTVNLSDS